MIKAILFDIDGVLVDSFDRNYKFFTSVLKMAGYKLRTTKKQFRGMFHMIASDIYQAMAGKLSETELKKLFVLGRKYSSKLPLVPMPGSAGVVKALAKKYKLAVVTSRNKYGMGHYFECSGNKKYFQAAVKLEDYKKPKPSPEPLLLACKRLNIKPREAIYIGDSKTDMQAARAGKMKIISFPKKLPGADGYAKNFKDIPKVVHKMV